MAGASPGRPGIFPSAVRGSESGAGFFRRCHAADRRAIRKRYAELVHKYHPDRNGGDRSYEKALQRTVSAYTQLRKSPYFRDSK